MSLANRLLEHAKDKNDGVLPEKITMSPKFFEELMKCIETLEKDAHDHECRANELELLHGDLVAKVTMMEKDAELGVAIRKLPKKHKQFQMFHSRNEAGEWGWFVSWFDDEIHEWQFSKRCDTPEEALRAALLGEKV